MSLSEWHVLYVRSRAEKKAALDLERAGMEVYLPLQRSLRQWSDRKKWVDLPILPGYLFVRSKHSSGRVLRSSSHLLGYVREGGKPAQLRSGEIEAIQDFLENYENIQLEPCRWSAGQEVQIQCGPMRGQLGELLSVKGNKARLRIDLLHVDLVAEVAIPHLKAV